MVSRAEGDERPAEQTPLVGEPHDPLSALRPEASAGAYDLALVGNVFYDIVFTGLPHPPEPGSEVHAEGMGSCPGGVANLAIAAARLGLRTTLSASFGEDVYGDFCWETLESGERIDLSASQRIPAWHSPVTVSVAYSSDRSMITHEHDSPIAIEEMTASLPPARAVFVELGNELPEWAESRAAEGALVFGGTGWDSSQDWTADDIGALSRCHAFLPNSSEAMRCTRTNSPEAALEALSELVPLAVVTRGDRGAIATDRTTGERSEVDGLQMDAIDPTGAGDVFGAALIVGTLAGWPLDDRLKLANLCAALSVQYIGGSLSAPGWADIALWYSQMRAVGDRRLREEYAFLGDLIPLQWRPTQDRRSVATLGLRPYSTTAFTTASTNEKETHS